MSATESALVRWFEESRRNLPWRETYDPYHVWISEVMLQQTQVETVLPYYDRFTRELPTVTSLAQAEEAEVLKLWSGLGYYSRARNLHRAAQVVVERHRGHIPSDYDSLIALPGIGRYMAGAILSIAFNKPYPIVDGNVRRVLSRLRGWDEENPSRLWAASEELVRAAEPRVVNQAIMELGATVCSFRSPRCLLCPIHQWCAAFKLGLQESMPPVRRRPATIHLLMFAVVAERKSKFLMKSVKGLWEFPMFSELPAGDFKKVGSCRHTITHHRLEVAVYTGILEETRGFEWKTLSSLAVSSLTRKIVREFQGRTL